jgi:hypothetical protein
MGLHGLEQGYLYFKVVMASVYFLTTVLNTPRGPGFDPMAVRVCVKWHSIKIFCEYFAFPLPIIISNRTGFHSDNALDPYLAGTRFESQQGR